MFEPGNSPQADDEEDAPHSPGMLSTSPEAAVQAEKAAALVREKQKGEDGPIVSEERLRELKAKARAEIQERINDKRKRRRLLRGTDS